MKFEYSRDVFPPGLVLPVCISVFGETGGKEAEAKVDTGADISVIPEQLRRDLRLLPHGFMRTRGAFDKKWKLCPTFFVTLFINQSFSFDLEVVACLGKYFLIGRDVLNQIVLYANGPLESFELTND